MLPLDGRIQENHYLVAVHFQGQVIVFGGEYDYNMYRFTEEGDLIEDLSRDPLIPGEMLWGSYTSQEGKIKAVGYRAVGRLVDWRMMEFDGKQ